MPLGENESHLDEMTLAAFAEGGVYPGKTADLVHVASCERCRRELGSLLALLGDRDVAAEMGRIAGRPNLVARPFTRRLLTSAGLLVAAALAFAVVRTRAPELAPDHRGPTITAASAPVLGGPIGDLTNPDAARTLQWSAVPGATRYRVTLFDAAGKVLFEMELSDTTASVPDSIAFAEGRSFLWKVDARTAWDRWTSSELVEFRVVPGGESANRIPLNAALPVASAGAPRSARDSLRLLAPRLTDSALTVEARARPLELREALSGTLARAVAGAPVVREQELRTARRLAAAYASAWRDSFLVREVERFSAWPAERRASKVWADSVRRAGNVAFARDGPVSAIVIWRRSLARFTGIQDTAGMAAALGNIGAGMAREGRADSADFYLGRSRSLAAAIGDLRVEANATSEIAGLQESREDFAGAREGYARAIALRQRIGDSRGLAADYNNLASLSQAAGDLEEASRQLEAALAINRRDGRAEVAATNLVNLAQLASMRGDYARAEAFYRSALATWRSSEQWADVADAERGLGELAIRRGDYPSARAHLDEALAIYDRTGPLAAALETRTRLGSVRAAAGDLQGALDELRRAQRSGDSARVAPGVRGAIVLARADLAVQLNMRPQADRLYDNAQSLFREARDRAGEAEALQGRGMLRLDEGDAAGAQRQLEPALRLQLATGNSRGASLTRLSLAAVALARADTQLARQEYVRAATELHGLGDPIGSAAATGERAAMEAAASLPAAAESLYRSALAGVSGRVAPEISWRLHAGLAAVRQQRGAPEDAVRELRAAIVDIERGGRSLALSERRSAFLNDKWDVYARLALLERDRGRIPAAFEVSERLRAGEMLGLLARGRVAAPRDTASELAAREQDLRRRIAELTRALERPPGDEAGQRGPTINRTGTVTREALLRAQESYGELLLEMRERSSAHAALVSRETVNARDVARRLAPDEAFIEYLLSDEGSIAFVITSDTVAAVTLAASRHDLARLVEFVRGTLQPRGSVRVDSLWRAPLRQLYQDLIGPIETAGLLRNRTRLIVVPHAELHYLPFAALLDGTRGHFLVQRFEISVTPSASVWLALGDRTRSKHATGVIAFAPRPDALPASRREVATIARILGDESKILIGSSATEAAFRADAPSRRVIHLATYGVLNKQNPLFSFVEFAPGDAGDNRLEAHEVFGLRLAADLVVLSACQTALASGALSDVPDGDDWIGLARAFLSAGAGNVMASLWPVQDRATAALMEEFYERYGSSIAPGRALAAAQRTMIAAPATSSPYYWAGFELVGGR